MVDIYFKKGKPMKKYVKLLFLVFLFVPMAASAEIKTIICEGTYNMGDGETPSVAEDRALINAKRVAIEEAGTYIRSYSEVKNLQLKRDEIQVLSSGIMEIITLEKKRTIVGDGGIKFVVKIKAQVKTDDLASMASSILDKSTVKDSEDVQSVYDSTKKNIEIQKRKLLQTKDKKERARIISEISENEKLFDANKYFERGNELRLKSEFDKAIEAYSAAIAFQTDHYGAYVNRGRCYIIKGAFNEALENFNRAIIIDPQNIRAYFYRGTVYHNTGKREMAIKDFNKVVVLQPIDDEQYMLRGLAFGMMEKTDDAIANLSEAIKLNPKNVKAAAMRGLYNFLQGEYDKSIEDLNKALYLKPIEPQDYVWRAMAYAL
jgi:tetratricopeptide (TPR) repeat protein